jgi:hypothetical protein
MSTIPQSFCDVHVSMSPFHNVSCSRSRHMIILGVFLGGYGFYYIMGMRIRAMDTTIQREATVHDMGLDKTFRNNYNMKCKPHHHIGCDPE